MANWQHRIKLKHLFTENEGLESVQASMNAIADVVAQDSWFARFNLKKFRAIPGGDDVITPVDYANKLLNRLYDYADEHLIWIE